MRYYDINPTQIVCLEGISNYTTIHLCCGKKMMFSKTLQSFENGKYDLTLIRPTRAYLVNIQAITDWKIGKKGLLEISLANGRIITASRRRKKQTLLQLQDNKYTL